jgi:hypothetical protein
MVEEHFNPEYGGITEIHRDDGLTEAWVNVGKESCGCREYPEYGNAFLRPRGHEGRHDWE